ncbi:hypothetical protein EN809_040095, partial [Mesorhizobium sp. M2E.F.Ca.ET.166.01.1.1]
LLQAASPQLVWFAPVGAFASVVPERRSDSIRWWRGLFRLGLVAAVGVASSVVEAREEAPDLGPPMRFAVVRSSAPGCEPNCPEWIAAEGTIEA